MTRKSTFEGQETRGTMGWRLWIFVASAVIGAGCATAAPPPSPGPERWPEELVGSWAFVPGARDTAVWTFRPDGHLIRSRIEVRTWNASRFSREQGRTLSRWWAESRERGYRLCTVARPGRGWMCGVVQVESRAPATACPRRTLTWTGTTFRQQWTLVERRECGGVTLRRINPSPRPSQRFQWTEPNESRAPAILSKPARLVVAPRS